MGEEKTVEVVGVVDYLGIGMFFLNTWWARVSPIVEAGLEDSEGEMDCDKY